ncbi:MAG: phage protein Gp19 [Nitrospirae bacterium]|nr:MAG: phage protein Gp19 [Nitrospirota bacterium]
MPKNYGMTEEAYTPDSLVAGDKVITKNGTLLTGENRARGALLGKITLGAVSETHAGNTGNGVLTPDAATPILANAQAGVYKAACIAAAVNGGTFRVSDPKGNVLGDVAVGVAFANQIKFVIADGAADFIVGDTFLITVAPGSLKYKLSAAAAVDGSQVPDSILVEATDATAADIDVGLYVGGEFNENAITFGAGHTADSVRDALRDKGIILKKGVPA